METTKIKIIILTRNRPDLLLKTVGSILKQSFKDIIIVISDNSSDNQTQKIIEQKFSHIDNLQYIKREPTFKNFFEHANKAISEVDTQYFMLFHDDDLMLPNLVKILAQTLDMHPNLIAVAANAYNIDTNDSIIDKFTPSKKRKLIKSPNDLINLYSHNKSLPFPSYMYRTSYVNKIQFDSNKGGKYSDSCFILDLLQKGDIMLLFDCYGMLYRRSDFQDSHFIDVKARCKQIKYFAKQSNIKYNSLIITKWRLKEIYTYYYLENKPIRKVVIKLFFKNRLYKLFLKSIIKKFVTK